MNHARVLSFFSSQFLCWFLRGWRALCCFCTLHQFLHPMTDNLKRWKVCSNFSFLFSILFGVASAHTDELNNPDHLKFQLWVECGDPHASRSLTPELFSEWKMESRGLRQLKREHDSSHADCHVWYRSGSLSPPCGLDYLSESRRERLKHIPGLSNGVVMRTLLQFASEFIFRERTTLLLF